MAARSERGRLAQACGGIILTASHNPEASTRLWHQVQHNNVEGLRRPSPLFTKIKVISQYKIAASMPDLDISSPKSHPFRVAAGDGEPTPFEVEVVDLTDEYTALMKTVDFVAIKELLQRSDFRLSTTR